MGFKKIFKVFCGWAFPRRDELTFTKIVRNDTAYVFARRGDKYCACLPDGTFGPWDESRLSPGDFAEITRAEAERRRPAIRERFPVAKPRVDSFENIGGHDYRCKACGVDLYEAHGKPCVPKPESKPIVPTSREQLKVGMMVEPTPQKEWPKWTVETSGVVSRWTDNESCEDWRPSGERLGPWFNLDHYALAGLLARNDARIITHAEAIRLIPAIADKYPLPTQRPAGESGVMAAAKWITDQYAAVGWTEPSNDTIQTAAAYAKHVTAEKDARIAELERDDADLRHRLGGLLDHVTNGKLSKTNYPIEVMREAADEAASERSDRDIAEATEELTRERGQLIVRNSGLAIELERLRREKPTPEAKSAEEYQAMARRGDNLMKQNGDLRRQLDEAYANMGAIMILAEWTKSTEAWGDEKTTGGELACAAACYAMPEKKRKALMLFRKGRKSALWPWARLWWRPSKKDRVRELVLAGALILAEIDRLKGAEVAAKEKA